ncbi:MAG: transposase [Anaerolineae bacterium]|nr:transposase [Anaerolineae bacterium]
MYCITFYLQKRAVYRCLSLLLLIGLLFQCFTPLQGREVWDEALLPWSKRCWFRRRRHPGINGLDLLKRRGRVLFCRLGLVAALLVWSGWPQRWPLSWALLSLPLADTLLSLLLPLLWPRLLKARIYSYLVCGAHDLYLLALVVLFSEGLLRPRDGHWSLLVSGCVRVADGAWARGEIEEDGTWRLEMEGHFIFTWKPRNFFEERILLVFFRQFRTPQSTPKRPFLRQEWLAEWFGVYQELISRWQRYVRQGGLDQLKGEYDGGLLTPEMCQTILDIWVPNFWLSARRVRERLLAEGHIASVKDISLWSIYQVALETGFAEVRRLLRQIFEFTADGPQWRDKVLFERLFELNEVLMARLQAGEGLTPQLTLEVEALKEAVGAPITPLKKPLPLAYRLQRALFGQWEEVDDGRIRCSHCGSDLVARKGNTPRPKKYRDPETKQWCETEGYRCYCLNPACACETFTNYPDGVRLYSSWTVDTVIWAVMVHMHLRTTYRRAADVVGVSHVTLWRWAMAVGEQALPIATLFGVVHSSGVVGIDEKWVLVPKNDKPEGERKRWMYVYLAVDVFTYDLLHIDIYPYNGKAEARAFLQTLKAKGYIPKVIITDMNQDYSEPIRAVFPHATHHECVFHALQWAQRLVKEVYGNDYAETHPEAVTLKEQIYKVFDAKTKRTVNKRYRKVMALEEEYVAHKPEAQRIFGFLERHYPKLVNAVENPLIPLTNNTVELVIRRFDQHYQNMCGFDSIETARKYLHLFELSYRFTPFARDNRPVKGRELDIRGKCPLELAGYDISQMPIARILRGQLLGWSPETLRELVPNA